MMQAECIDCIDWKFSNTRVAIWTSEDLGFLIGINCCQAVFLVSLCGVSMDFNPGLKPLCNFLKLRSFSSEVIMIRSSLSFFENHDENIDCLMRCACGQAWYAAKWIVSLMQCSKNLYHIPTYQSICRPEDLQRPILHLHRIHEKLKRQQNI